MTGEQFTVDTNILVYASTGTPSLKQSTGREVMKTAARRDCRLTLQSVSEFYHVTVRKRFLAPAEAAVFASDWLALFQTIAAQATAVRGAIAVAATGRSSYWDALLACTAAEGGCTAILTEDLADGTTFCGLRVINPFGPSGMSPAAAALLT